MTIEEYFGDWSKVVDLKEVESIMKKLSTSSRTYTICPQIKDIFKAFKLCSLKDLKVILLAYDPYPGLYKGKPRATGLAFANAANTPEKDYSPSLEILKESVIDYTKPHGIITFEPSLEKWEEQGVLLLNSALTCQLGKTDSHSLLWRPFISSFLTNLSKCAVGIIYVLLGSHAQAYEPYINKESNHIIRCRHPSYYARTNTRMPSDVWKQVNDILIGQSGYGIEWFKEDKFSND